MKTATTIGRPYGVESATLLKILEEEGLYDRKSKTVTPQGAKYSKVYDAPGGNLYGTETGPYQGRKWDEVFVRAILAKRGFRVLTKTNRTYRRANKLEGLCKLISELAGRILPRNSTAGPLYEMAESRTAYMQCLMESEEAAVATLVKNIDELKAASRRMTPDDRKLFHHLWDAILIREQDLQDHSQRRQKAEERKDARDQAALEEVL